MLSAYSFFQLSYYLGKYLTDHDLPGPPKDHLLLAPCPEEPHITDRRFHFSLEKKLLTLTLYLNS